MKVSTILDHIDSGHMALPEFQRGYVWNRDQVRGLFDSLYRRHPVGGLLVWATESRTADHRGDGPLAAGVVKLLLNGQQRMTSLYGVVRGRPPKFFDGNAQAFTGLRFHLDSETFEFYQPLKMKDDPLWIDVTELMRSGTVGLGDFVTRLAAQPALGAKVGGIAGACCFTLTSHPKITVAVVSGSEGVSMRRSVPGRYVKVSTAGEPFQAFVPDPLPPEPPIAWSGALRRRFDEALLALGRLDALAAHLPNADLLLYSFVRKEAVLSSQIEGTQSSLADLLLYEIEEQPGVPVEDAREVSRCVAALERGTELLKGGLPLSMRLLRQVHAVLMGHPHGKGKASGEVRRSQVWIGGTRPGNAVFVPPPADALPDCLRSFERFLNDEPEPTPPLLKAALGHVQFETIHPFLDGNGRVGRLLIVLQLVADGVLRAPMLYPSLFFKAHRSLYYELLNDVRLHGDWERWLDFFAEGVQVSARQAVTTANELLALVATDRIRITALGRAASSALAVHQALQRQPIATAGALVKATGLTAATVNKSLAHLERVAVVSELTQRQRGRVFSYRRYVEILGSELEPR